MKTLMVILFLWNNAQAQFYVNNKVTFQPELILPAHYTAIDLKPYIGVSGLFDARNPYTTLISIKDERHQTYQMIVQTGFLGNLQYAGVSSNLWMHFNKSNKPMFAFRACMNRLNNLFNFASPADHLTDCVIQRLNENAH